MKKTFTTAYNRKDDFIRTCNAAKFTKPSMVKQSLSYAVDINTIYDNYCKTGKLPLNGQQPLYDENFVKYDSLIAAQKLVDEATKYFVGLPAKIKNQYGNSLEKFVLALNNKDEFLVKEGLLNLPTPAPTSEVIMPSDDISPVVPQTDVKTDVNTVTTD